MVISPVIAGKRPIRDGREFEKYFPKPNGINDTIKRDARLRDTLDLIRKVVRETLNQTALIAPVLKRKTAEETCKAIWNWCFTHFQYEKDEKGKEQVRSPARSWHDRKKGIDCDCFYVLVSSILTNLGIPHFIRLTRYAEPDFEHIYVVAKADGKMIPIDPVISRANYEVPYTEKLDKPMELQYLNGVPGNAPPENIDADDLFGEDQLAGRAERQERKQRRKDKRQERRQERREGTTTGGRIANSINRFNPATGLLRAGILASMKLNLFKIAERIRWAYLDQGTVQRKGLNVQVWQKLKGVHQKLEKIFFGAGGRRENLKKAILTGKGNKDRGVLAGLGFWEDYSESSALNEILGPEMYQEEVQGDGSGLSGLGEIATGTAIAAATSVLGAIAAVLKSIGDIKKGGNARGGGTGPGFSTESGGGFTPDPPGSSPDPNVSSYGPMDIPPETGGGKPKGKFLTWLKNNWWIPALGITAVGGGVTAVVVTQKKKKGKKPVNGPASKPKSTTQKRQVILLD